MIDVEGWAELPQLGTDVRAVDTRVVCFDEGDVLEEGLEDVGVRGEDGPTLGRRRCRDGCRSGGRGRRAR